MTRSIAIITLTCFLVVGAAATSILTRESMQATDGHLKIKFPEGLAVFHLGEKAEKWADRIRNPPSRLDKLGVKQESKVQLIGKHDDDFRRDLADRGAVTVKSKPDLAFLADRKSVV